MAFDPKNREQVDALCGSHYASRQKMEVFRANRLSNIKAFLGKHQTDNSAVEKQPLNQLNLFVLIVLRLLVSSDPQALVTTRFRDLRSLANDLEQWMNWRIVDMKMVDTLRLITFDALFLMGIGKVGITTDKSYEWEGETHYYGEPFFDHIDFDDWVHDMRCTRRDQWTFCGHRFRMPLDVAMKEESFDPEVRKNLEEATRRFLNEQGDERIKNIELDSHSPANDTFSPTVELWEIYLPVEQMILTMVCDVTGRLTGEVLRAEPWVGPCGGPYHILTFMDVPSNTMPSPPVAQLIDLNELINSLYCKLGRQAQRQKKNTFYRGASEKDTERIRDAEDGQAVHVEDPEGTREVSMGGIDPQNWVFVQQSMEAFNRLAGNMDVMGGLGQQAGTLGQEQLLQSNSSAQLKDMQGREVGYVKQVIGQNGLAWYWFNDDVTTHEVERKVPGIDFTTMAKITPQKRQGNFSKLNFDIHPVSIQGHTPSELSQKLEHVFMNIILPSGPLLQQQQAAPNIQGFIKIWSKLNNFPYADELVTFQAPIEGDEQPKDEPPKMQMPNTPTMNIRKNISQGTTPGKNAAAMQAIIGAGNNSGSQAQQVGG